MIIWFDSIVEFTDAAWLVMFSWSIGLAAPLGPPPSELWRVRFTDYGRLLLPPEMHLRMDRLFGLTFASCPSNTGRGL